MNDYSNSRRLPRPSLASKKTELDALYDELGGPVDLVPGFDKFSLESGCHQFPFVTLKGALEQFQCDEIKVRQHWPWAAFACTQYRFERDYRAKHPNTEEPADLCALAKRIAESAQDLTRSLARLSTLANAPHDPFAVSRQGHLTWADMRIGQAIAGIISPNVDMSDEVLVASWEARGRLYAQLTKIEVTAQHVYERLDRQLLSKDKASGDPALQNLVYRASMIWTSLTNRKSSAGKSVTKSGSEPPFVRFVQSLAHLACSTEPTRRQIELALERLPPHSGK